MGLTTGFGTQQKQDKTTGPIGPPFAVTSAVNGLSVNGSGQIVLGNDTGGTAATLLSNRLIPLSGFSFTLVDGLFQVGTALLPATFRGFGDWAMDNVAGATFASNGGMGVINITGSNAQMIIGNENFVLNANGSGFIDMRTAGGTSRMLIGNNGSITFGTIAGIDTAGNFTAKGNGSFLNGAMLINLGGSGSTPALHSTSTTTIQNDQNTTILQGSSNLNLYPELRLTGINTTTAMPFSGVINGSDLNTANTAGQPLLITTTGFNNAANGISGDIILQPNTNAASAFAPLQNHDWNIFLKPSRFGGVRLANNGNATANNATLLEVNGTASIYQGVYYKIQTVTTSLTVDDTYYSVLVDASAGNINITLPPSAGAYKSGAGRLYNFVRIDTSGSFVNLLPSAGETINGAGNITLNPNLPVTVQAAGGTKWFTVS